MARFDDPRRDEAAAWFSAQRRGAMSFEERARFDAWRANPGNQAALDSMHQLWGEVSGLKQAVQVGRATSRPSIARHRVRYGLAAALMIMVFGAGSALWLATSYFGPRSASTVVGEQRATTLPDGSIVNLNVLTRIDYRVNEERREISLQDGEALFFVHKDASRPFRVRAGSFEVQAVGTAFNVRQRDGDTQVTVLEGSVLVRSLDGPGAGREIARLSAGQKVSLKGLAAGHAVEVKAVPLQSVAEWRTRTVSYEDVLLADVVTDLNRFYTHPLQISDTNLAHRRITLRLQVEDRERTLQTLAALLGAEVRAGSDADTLMTAPAASPE